MTLNWHARYTQQARWTQDLRRYLFQRAGWQGAGRVLEVGCGTGAVLGDLPGNAPWDGGHPMAIGLDITRANLNLARSNVPQARLVEGDAQALPFAEAAFDLTFCHFLLLWVSDPLQAVREMQRVTRPGGAVLALAEPDYGGRIDYPAELAQLGMWQTEALRQQGADVLIGRKLAGILHAAGLEAVETGVLGGQWVGAPSREAWELEWQVFDLDVNTPDARRHRAADWEAWQRGERVLFVPTFYAWGRTPALLIQTIIND